MNIKNRLFLMIIIFLSIISIIFIIGYLLNRVDNEVREYILGHYSKQIVHLRKWGHKGLEGIDVEKEGFVHESNIFIPSEELIFQNSGGMFNKDNLGAILEIKICWQPENNDNEKGIACQGITTRNIIRKRQWFGISVNRVPIKNFSQGELIFENNEIKRYIEYSEVIKNEKGNCRIRIIFDRNKLLLQGAERGQGL